MRKELFFVCAILAIVPALMLATLGWRDAIAAVGVIVVFAIVALMLSCGTAQTCKEPCKAKPTCAPIANKRVRRHLRSDPEFIAHYFKCYYQMRQEMEIVSEMPSRKDDRYYEEYRTRMRTLPARRMLAKLLAYLDAYHPETEGA